MVIVNLEMQRPLQPDIYTESRASNSDINLHASKNVKCPFLHVKCQGESI